ncbi:MAG: type II toxin-antitoxin system Phd/YefM family antitoxin [Deltaproteobacteria bacterium]|nr:type II toxin-antitoxin system Phd/YefM family antitoxin [Deltaproteobacteria bacterium]
MKEVPLSEVKDDLSRYLRLAEKEGIVITRHGAYQVTGAKHEEDRNHHEQHRCQHRLRSRTLADGRRAV